MAEFDLNEIVETLNDQYASVMDSNSLVDQIEQNLRGVEDQIKAQVEVEPNIKEKLNDQLEQEKAKRAENASKFLGSVDDFNKSIAKKIGVSPNDMDLSRPVSDWHPNVKKWFFDLGDDIGENIRKLQKSVGEDGRPLEKSPQTIGELRRFYETYIGPNGLKIFLSVYIALAAFSVGKNWKRDFEQKNKSVGSFQSVGCFQYNTKSGTIRSLGICGAMQNCAPRPDQTSCEAPNPVKGYCQWLNGTCVPGQHFTNGTQCGMTCSTDGDCHSVSPVSCDPVNNPCLVGYCQNGKCQGGQTCDQTTKQCTPPISYDPKFPISQQMDQGRLGFCLGGMPPIPCPGTASICSPAGDDDNGCCPVCQDNDPSCSDMTGGISQSSCLCKGGKDWVTISMCGGISPILSMLSYMQINTKKWVPQKTPLVIYIVTGIGIVIFLVTLVWYVFYLIKHGKK